MSKRTVGLGFIFISSLFYCTRYLSAAIYGSSLTNATDQMFIVLLDSVGTKLLTLSKFSLFVGLVYLIWAEISELLPKFNMKKRPRS